MSEDEKPDPLTRALLWMIGVILGALFWALVFRLAGAM